MVHFSLIIPCYNEAANLPLLVERCTSIVHRQDVEIILVDNGSSDETPEVLAKLLAGHVFIRSVRVDINRGYGFGIVSGLRAAKGQILAWTHADMQTDPADALVGLDYFDRTTDPQRLFVKGRRYGRPLMDVLFTIGMSCFESLWLQKRLWDINAQPTMFTKEFFDTWQDPPDDFSLDLYAYYQARAAGLEVLRFPVRFGERAHGISHWNVDWKSKYKFIRRTFEYSLKLKKNL